VKFLLDENAEFRIARFLRDQGHDVMAIAHDYPHALADEQVLSVACDEARILVTNDRDFGEMVIRRGKSHSGIVYLRLPGASVERKIARLRAVLVSHENQLDRFLVVTEHRIRVVRESAAG
jgi:predicted nuclease of predicted toxin-antitoxin system